MLRVAEGVIAQLDTVGAHQPGRLIGDMRFDGSCEGLGHVKHMT